MNNKPMTNQELAIYQEHAGAVDVPRTLK